jgi:outer membrane protein assembly factor BamB
MVRSLVCLALAAPAASVHANTLELAAHLVETSGMSRGICSVVGCDDGDFVFEVSQSSEFLVHAWDPRPEAVQAVRKTIDDAQLYGQRVVIEQGPLGALPYADESIDLVLAAHLTPRTLAKVSPADVLRVLRPLGKAIVGRAEHLPGAGNALNTNELEVWVAASGVKGASVVENDFGVWAILTKPAAQGVDDWSHWEHGPDNNPVSQDQVIKAPYMTKWLGRPFYIAMPAITTAAGGRIFIAIGHIAHHKREEQWLNTLIARNGYNGTILWIRKLPDGYFVHRSGFVATQDVFYMIDSDGSGCLMLDAETGEELGRLDIGNARGQWKWMAMHDGILYALIGKEKDPAETTIVRSNLTHWSWGELSQGYYDKRVPWGFGRTLVAFDLSTKKALWTHREKLPLDSRAMCIGGDKIFAYSPDARLICLDPRTGQEIWSNDEDEVREQIEQPGRGLSSTPGFRSMTFCVYTPDALIYQAQTRMNVVAISTKDGSKLWQRKKTTNNPNALYVDNNVAIGIGEGGSTLMVNPLTGSTIEDLGFTKRSCARLTATSDSFFCRGWPEGLTRYDRNNKKVLFNGAFRPSCNDGIVPANGHLYLGPWACDCNLTLIGRVALTSAGDFEFDHPATDAERLQHGDGDINNVAPLEVTAEDWSIYRGNSARGAATKVTTPDEVSQVWSHQPATKFHPTAVTTAGGLVFLAGDDGKVRAVDATTGDAKWSSLTGGAVLQAPTIWNGRAYFGSADGFVYAVDATTGRFLWRFRAAPIERRIAVYGTLSSTWPVHSGVLVQDGVAYVAAGIVDYDGTYVYALDAVTGKIKWHNNSSGHLDPDLRKGVSAQGTLAIAQGRLWMPGGNVVSPAAYDLETGKYAAAAPGDGSPKANRGEEIGIFRDRYVFVGGRLRFSAVKNVVNPGRFTANAIKPGKDIGKPGKDIGKPGKDIGKPGKDIGKPGKDIGDSLPLHQGKIPPAWRDDLVVMINGRLSAPAGYDAQAIEAYLAGGDAKKRPEPMWTATALEGADTVALAVASNAVLAVCERSRARNRESRWVLTALDPKDGTMRWERTLPGEALPGGLSVDRKGRILVVLDDGRVICYGNEKSVRANLVEMTHLARRDAAGKRRAVRILTETLKTTHSPSIHKLVMRGLSDLGVEIDSAAREAGFIGRWHLIGPVPWDDKFGVDHAFFNEPNVNIAKDATVAGRAVTWRQFISDDPNGMVDLAGLYGPLSAMAAYGYAEVELPTAGDMLLMIGSNDGYKCWFNGREVGRFDGGRGYSPDQDTYKVKGQAGVNRVLIKVTQMGSAWAFGVRMTDLNNKPIRFEQASG